MEQQTKPADGKKRPRMTVVVGKKFRLVIPQHIREGWGLKEGDALLSFVEDGRCKIMTEAQAYEHIAKCTDASKPNILVIGKQFRVVIPQHIREDLGLNEGDTLLSFVEDGRWIVMTEAQARQNVADAKRKLPGATSVVDQLILERRWEFAKEEEELAASRLRMAESGYQLLTEESG